MWVSIQLPSWKVSVVAISFGEFRVIKISVDFESSIIYVIALQISHYESVRLLVVEGSGRKNIPAILIVAQVGEFSC